LLGIPAPAADSGASARTRTATPEPAPARTERSERPSSAGSEQDNPWRQFLKAMSKGVLTDREAKELRPKMLDAVRNLSDNADELLSTTNRAQAHAEIWSTMDEQDIETLTDALLMLGQRSAPVAGVVRMVADTMLGWQAMLILGPRLWQTARWYPQHGGFAIQ
jgi:DNA-directed RNA polymerase subunit F